MSLSANTLPRLRAIVGAANLQHSPEERIAYSYDATPMLAYQPEAIVFVESASQISEVLKLANAEGFKVVPRGSGTNLSGGTVPMENCVVLVTVKMDKILEIDPRNLTALVEPGVLTARIDEAAGAHGLFYPPDPGSIKISTIGGNVAENSGGLRGLKYGVTRDYVLGLEVVLPSGELMRCGTKCVKDVAGYSLKDLFIGSEGTLGVVTQVLLKLLPRPAGRRTMLATFNAMTDAAETVSDIIAQKIIPCTLEFLDRMTIRCVEDYAKIGLPLDAEAILLMETDGHPVVVEEESARMIELARAHRARDVRVAKDATEAEKLTAARRSAFSALARVSPTTILEDATVPRSELATMIAFIQQTAEKYKLRIGIFGHFGDGNLHPTFLCDERNPEEIKRVHAAFREIFEKAMALGGTITGEHGIGMAKKGFLEEYAGKTGMDVMRALKYTLDPKHVLNPVRSSIDFCRLACATIAFAAVLAPRCGSAWQAQSFLYQLQNLNVTNAAASAFPVIVTDYSHDGSGAGELTSNEVAMLKAGGTKTVLAYLSIGEAESYRYYWNPAWVDQGAQDPDRPAWLGPANPDFRNNYKVQYWDPAWQAIIFGSTNSYLDRVLAKGFDGVYLDVIDAYEFWGPDGGLPISRENSDAVPDMVNFVLSLAAYARAKPGHTNFLVVPQNGAALVTNANYLAGISALGAEDTWFNGSRRQQTADTAYVVPLLDLVRAAGKPVFAIDYPLQTQNIDMFYSLAEAKGYTPYASDRGLDQLIVQPHHNPAITISTTPIQPADRTEVRSTAIASFGWTATGGNGSLKFHLSFTGDDAFTRTLQVPKAMWITTTNYIPAAAEWKTIIQLAGDNPAGRIWWWITAEDGSGRLHTSPAQRLYRLHTNVSTTEFWVGEPADSDNGHIANAASAWDELWETHFGGVDDPTQRNTNSAHPYWPAFTPHENPFYFALPYDDLDNRGNRRSNFQQVIPWARFTDYGSLESAIKNHWIKIIAGSRTCYAQWEDVGPFKGNDFRYVFGLSRPANKGNQHAGLDTSPAVQQYLGLSGLDLTDWRFLFPDEAVPPGPWTEIITTNQITWLP